MEPEKKEKGSSLRWKILRNALLRHRSPSNQDYISEIGIKQISRKTTHGFNLIPSHIVNNDDDDDSDSKKCDVCVCYTLPIPFTLQLFLKQRVNNHTDLTDFEICNRYNIDNTGLVCNWPSEEVLAHYCMSHLDMFRSKKVIELGSGYGLAGFVIAAVTGASQVVISDGNPRVVNYTQRNIETNRGAFGDTIVKSMMLHWNQEEVLNVTDTFDIIVASDCTFFKDFHKDLASIVKKLLSKSGSSEAIFLSPKRGDSLDLFLEVVQENGLHFSVTENYDMEVWKRHEGFLNGEDKNSWPSYEKGIKCKSIPPTQKNVLAQTLTKSTLSLHAILFYWGHILSRQRHYSAVRLKTLAPKVSEIIRCHFLNPLGVSILEKEKGLLK